MFRQRLYGQNVPALLVAIQKSRQNFRKLPLGPIGIYNSSYLERKRTKREKRERKKKQMN